MKTAFCTVICLTALILTSAHAQPSPPPAPQMPRAPVYAQPVLGGGGGIEAAPLTRFDLDFPGGTPKDLVAAIQKAMGRPLNAIIPDDLAATKLPALKMTSVDVSQLFQALTASSRKNEIMATSPSARFGPAAYPGFSPSYSTFNTVFGFRQASEGRPTDDTIWYFYAERPVVPPSYFLEKVCRFYSLAPYLDRGVTVDDITTAIETGWKMLGESSRATISFHKDTKLLIAVGEPSKLEAIDAVLKALEPPKPPPAGPAPAAKPVEKPKTDK